MPNTKPNLDELIEQQTANVNRAIGYLSAFQWLKQQGYQVVAPNTTPQAADPPNQPEGIHVQAQVPEAASQ